MNLIDVAESRWTPDFLIRVGIRRLLADRLAELETVAEDDAQFLDRLAEAPTAVETDAANRQHYETPAWFFENVLGKRLKYSCGYFADEQATLDEAEESMLRLTCERAALADGQRILELGCGWGSLTLWMAEHFPDAEITAISNSHSQRKFIEARLASRDLANVSVKTVDMREFQTSTAYDRIVSVEMFEHMRNYRRLFRQVARWLEPDGQAFVHAFCHRQTPYLFEARGPNDWMARHFFTGGAMPSESLFRHATDDLAVVDQWRVDGKHYWKTCEAWLRNLDRNYHELSDAFAAEFNRSAAARMLQRWRIFFMACGELFRYHNGGQWFVTHYLFESTARR